MKRALLIFLFVHLGLRSFAQETVSGFIYGADDQQPLLGAHVVLLSDWSINTISDQSGAFSIRHSGSNSDSLLITFVSYEELTVPTNYFLSNSSIYLKPKEQVIKTLVVTADKIIAEEFTSHKIKRLDIYKNPSSKADPLLAVNSLASSTTTDESANISFRGSSAGETGIFMDGVPIYDYVRFSQLNGIGTLSVFNTDLVGSVNVFPGNPPLEFGNVTSGLVAIRTSETIPQKNTGTINASLANVGGSYTTSINDNQRLHIYVNYQPSAVFRALNRTSLEDILSFNSLESGTQYVNQINKDWKFKVFNYAQIEGYTFNYQSPTFQGNFLQDKKRNLSILNVTRQFKSSQLQFAGGVNVAKLDFSYSAADFNLQNLDLFTSASYFLEKENWSLKSGISIDYRNSDFSGQLPEFSFAERPEDPFISASNTSNRTINESYLYFKYIIVKDLSLGLAGRKNLPFGDQKSYLARQLNLSYNISSHWKLNAAFGTFFNSPLDQNNTLIESDQVSLDLFFQKNDHDFILSLFQKNIKGQNHVEDIHGLEITYSKTLSNYRFNFSYTFLNADVTEEDSRYSGDFDFNYFLRLGAEWSFLPGWSLGTRGLFRPGTWDTNVIEATFFPELNAFEPTYSSPENRNRLNAYNIIDFNLSKLQNINTRLGAVFFISMSNAFNFSNQRGFIYDFDYQSRTPSYFSRRTWYFGVALNLN